MRLTRGIIALLLLAAVLVGSAGCIRAEPWKGADKQLRAVARDVAQKAESDDVNYFRGLCAARDRISELMGEIERSGLATNYAEHLKVRSDTDAVLDYGLDAGLDPPTNFTIQLSLKKGELTVDQIVFGETPPAPTKAPTRQISVPVVSAEMTSTSRVDVALPSRRPLAGSEQVAFISYLNTSDEERTVPQPPDVGIIIIDLPAGKLVKEWNPLEPPGTEQPLMLAPLQSSYGVVRFKAPKAGRYLVFGRANGVLSAPLEIQTEKKSE